MCQNTVSTTPRPSVFSLRHCRALSPLAGLPDSVQQLPGGRGRGQKHLPGQTEKQESAWRGNNVEILTFHPSGSLLPSPFCHRRFGEPDSPALIHHPTGRQGTA